MIAVSHRLSGQGSRHEKAHHQRLQNLPRCSLRPLYESTSIHSASMLATMLYSTHKRIRRSRCTVQPHWREVRRKAITLLRNPTRNKTFSLRDPNGLTTPSTRTALAGRPSNHIAFPTTSPAAAENYTTDTKPLSALGAASLHSVDPSLASLSKDTTSICQTHNPWSPVSPLTRPETAPTEVHHLALLRASLPSPTDEAAVESFFAERDQLKAKKQRQLADLERRQTRRERAKLMRSEAVRGLCCCFAKVV